MGFLCNATGDKAQNKEECNLGYELGWNIGYSGEFMDWNWEPGCKIHFCDGKVVIAQSVKIMSVLLDCFFFVLLSGQTGAKLDETLVCRYDTDLE